jgi:hypothetical protein
MRQPSKHSSGAVIAVGSGRGFLIKNAVGDLLVVTAAHCLPSMPVPHPWADESRTWPETMTPGLQPDAAQNFFSLAGFPHVGQHSA